MPAFDSPRTDRAGALARQLALAAQWGLEDVPNPPPATPPRDEKVLFLDLPAAQDLRFGLEPFADTLGHSCTTPAGFLGLPLRLLRGGVKFLLGPWLDVQTQFNKAVLKTLLHDQAASRTYLHQLATHVRNQQAELAELYDRLDRCRHEIAALKQVQRVSVRHVVEALAHSGASPSSAEANGDACPR